LLLGQQTGLRLFEIERGPDRATVKFPISHLSAFYIQYITGSLLSVNYRLGDYLFIKKKERVGFTPQESTPHLFQVLRQSQNVIGRLPERRFEAEASFLSIVGRSSAGINRYEAENERVLQERNSEPS
jgi:hypothetical protein